MARATVEMMRTSELRKGRKIGGFFGAERIRPMEYFISLDFHQRHKRQRSRHLNVRG